MNALTRTQPRTEARPSYTPASAQAMEDAYITGMAKEGYLKAPASGNRSKRRLSKEILAAEIKVLLGSRPHTTRQLRDVLNAPRSSLSTILVELKTSGAVQSIAGAGHRYAPNVWCLAAEQKGE